uniref:Reverse transcriptase Ty1/copia-type domain-containing protein n=1 Tax=Lactuca sativa TaxID=4236 RepID=A0A9R1WFF1_LACSA|nr:hypothetical protein LSAT_V11C200076470 [Lactuca sativa]
MFFSFIVSSTFHLIIIRNPNRFIRHDVARIELLIVAARFCILGRETFGSVLDDITFKFEGFRGLILHRTPLPTVDSVVHELIAEETRIKSHVDKGPKKATPAIFVVPQQPQSSNSSKLHLTSVLSVRRRTIDLGVINLFECAQLTDNVTVDTPIESNAKYSPTYGVPLSDTNIYRTIVGSLVYLTVTRSDIDHAVHVVGQFVIAPSTIH